MLFASSASNDCECTNTLAHKGLEFCTYYSSTSKW